MRKLLALICIVLVVPLIAFATPAKKAARKRAAAKTTTASGKRPAARSTGKSKGKTAASRKGRRGRAAVAVQSGPTSQRIAQIQEALGRAGFYKQEPSGRWDAQTVAALSSFQAANDIEVTGKLGAWTLKKLEEKHGLPSNSELTESAQSGSTGNQ